MASLLPGTDFIILFKVKINVDKKMKNKRPLRSCPTYIRTLFLHKIHVLESDYKLQNDCKCLSSDTKLNSYIFVSTHNITI